MRHKRSLNPDYFERMFQSTDDPWEFETSAYERSKYAHSIEALRKRRYERGLEIGCANGVMTRLLAAQCQALLAVDVSQTAIAAAARRCANLDGVDCQVMQFPRTVPVGAGFDLITLSEVVYYWDDGDIARAAAAIRRMLEPGGDLLLVHWTGETDYPQSGDDAVAKLHAGLGNTVKVLTAETCPKYRLDLWRALP